MKQFGPASAHVPCLAVACRGLRAWGRPERAFASRGVFGIDERLMITRTNGAFFPPPPVHLRD